MLNSSGLKKSYRRLTAVVIILSTVLCASGCSSLLGVKRPVKVPQLLTPLQNASMGQLIAEINRLASIRSIRGKVDIQFQDTSFAESGLAEKYRTADGTITVQRPGQILLVIQLPLVGTDIAQMTSDGKLFRVAVLQGEERYRKFVMGSNAAVYSKLDAPLPGKDSDGKDKKTVQTERVVSVFSNLRPQHFTEAFLIDPVKIGDGTGKLYSQTEAYEVEPDTRLRAGKNVRIVRGYYILDELTPGADGTARVLRRFWFDRVEGIRLARIQTFDEKGALITDIVYGPLKPLGEQGILFPSSIELTRPQDRYKISIGFQAPESVRLDHDYPAEAFVLQNRWNLPEVNLDDRTKGPNNDKQ
jgi:hypothetical protein